MKSVSAGFSGENVCMHEFSTLKQSFYPADEHWMLCMAPDFQTRPPLFPALPYAAHILHLKLLIR